jgi:hypothetical protein
VLFESIMMQSEQELTAELVPLNPIRIETALSRYPVHRLTKHGEIAIDIREHGKDGEVAIRWEVSHNSKFGQPGPLAYKLDTLIINRRIEEALRPVPRIIRLGSLHDICKELGQSEGENKNTIKRALYQNAGAFITAKTRYRQSNGTECNIEIGDTRYGVVFTGEKLPDGRTADAVYIVLHDFYREILDTAITRPLDYDYLSELSPAPQRFYELLSYQMYAALKHDRARAKLVYSEFCTHAPQTRYMEFDRVKKQMHKIHSVHRKSGYIAGINYEQATDGKGQPDWIMLYVPGPKAKAEFRTFTRRGAAVMLDIEPSPMKPAIAAPPPTQLDLPLAKRRKTRSQPKPAASPLVAELVQRGVTAAIAAVLARDYDAETIRHQMEILDWMEEKKPGKVDDPAAWLVSAIRNGHAAPKGFVSKAERDRQAEAKRQAARAAAEERRRAQTEETRQEERRREEDAYWSKLTPAGQAELEARALAEAGELAQQTYATLKRLKGGGKGYLANIRREYIRALIDAEQAAFP